MKLSIPEPCHENWNKMTATQKGKFCGSCQKDLIDFSKMTKVEIKNYFIRQAGKSTCGRFETRQLIEFNRPKVESRKLNTKPWWIAAATLFVFAKPGFSQEVSVFENKPKVEINKAPVAMEAPKDNKVDPGDEIQNDSLVTISGQIIDENGEPIFAATIKINDTALGCITDFDGKFKLIVPEDHQDSIKIEVSFIGFLQIERTYFEIKKSKNIGVIKLEERSVILGGCFTTGIVSYEEQEPTQATLFRRFRMKLRNGF